MGLRHLSSDDDGVLLLSMRRLPYPMQLNQVPTPASLTQGYLHDNDGLGLVSPDRSV